MALTQLKSILFYCYLLRHPKGSTRSGRWGMEEGGWHDRRGVTVYKSGISAAFFVWFFVIDGLLLEGEAFKGGL